MAVTANLAAGQVLNASTVNTYMINSGLVYVTSTTVGSGVSSVTISNCFSSTYDNYRIEISGVASTSGYSMYMSLNNRTGTTYANGGRYMSLGGASADASSAGEAGFWLGVMGTNFSACLDLFRPNSAGGCNVAWSSSSSTYGNYGNGYNSVASASTSLTMYPAFGTLTGGTITVYGYRKA